MLKRPLSHYGLPELPNSPIRLFTALGMFNFWRRTNKQPSGQKPNVLPASQPDVSESTKQSQISPSDVIAALVEHPESSLRPSGEPQEQVPPQPVPEPYVAATPNPHDSVISEIQAGLRPVELLMQSRRSTTAALGQTGDRTHNDDPPVEILFDPATGEQKGTFNASHPASPAGNTTLFEHVNTELANDEVWSHLARIRALQSDIARMHAHMEGIGDNKHALDIDVDVDIDVDSVPTQEEEEAVKRQKEFEKLPGRFTGRSENIDAVMAKLDELSKAVTAFHALQPPPLNFDNTSASEENTAENPSPVSPRTAISNIHTAQIIFPSSRLTPATGTGNQFSSDVMHDSPVSLADSFVVSTANH